MDRKKRFSTPLQVRRDIRVLTRTCWGRAAISFACTGLYSKYSCCTQWITGKHIVVDVGMSPSVSHVSTSILPSRHSNFLLVAFARTHDGGDRSTSQKLRHCLICRNLLEILAGHTPSLIVPRLVDGSPTHYPGRTQTRKPVWCRPVSLAVTEIFVIPSGVGHQQNISQASAAW